MATDWTKLTTYVESARSLGPLICEHAEFGQAERRLAPEVVEAFHAAGLFRLSIPEELNGAGFGEDELAPVIDALAQADASTAWNVAIANGSSAMVRCLAEEVAGPILADPRVVTAGSGGPRLKLVQREGGFVLSGRGPFASGCMQSNWFVAIATVRDETNRLVLNSAGSPTIRMVFVPDRETTIIDTWRSTGLRGTGSHDVEFHDVFVPKERAFNAEEPNPTRFDPLWHVSLNQRLGPHLSAVAIGAASHAVAELTDLAAGKRNAGFASLIRERGDVQHAVGRASSLIEAARALIRVVPTEVLDLARDGSPLPQEQALRIRMACVTATSFAVEAVDLVNAAAGTSSLSEASIIGRCWRDVHAVSQHVSQQPKLYEAAGRAALGVPYEMLM